MPQWTSQEWHDRAAHTDERLLCPCDGHPAAKCTTCRGACSCHWKGSTTQAAPGTCTRCCDQPEGMCSRCGGDGNDPDSPDCGCDCCGGTGACDMCFDG